MGSRLFRRKEVSAILAELHASQNSAEGGQLAKNLNLFDLVCFGIAAIVGAGIFSTIGSAAASGGPAVTLLFIGTAITCLFSALCYAEFAARIPVSGSAYTYSYAAFGELVAWIIGWDLLMEYAIGNSVIAFSWSEYFSTFLRGLNIDLVSWIETDYYSCLHAVRDHAAAARKIDLPALLAAVDVIEQATAQGLDAEVISSLPAQNWLQHARELDLKPEQLFHQTELIDTWNRAPQIAGWRMIVDMPALAIDVAVTGLVYIGIKESKTASNLMVMLKIAVVLGVIAVGVFYVRPSNWSPFAPNGASGVLHGIAAVFFAYIGFDAISTTAEECKNPQRDLPRATVLTLIICTLLYVSVAMVLTGMVSYQKLGVADPLADVFNMIGLDWIAGIVSLSAIVAITSVFLVFQIGQPRIWMSMARDGLLPKRFAKIHPRFKTPAFSTVVTGFVVALPIVFLNQAVVTDLCSIGTLFAFMLVSAGVLRMAHGETQGTNENLSDGKPPFRVPYVRGRWFVLGIWLAYTLASPWALPENHNVFAAWSLAKSPYVVFYVVMTAMTLGSFVWRWSLIPVLGVLSNMYLIAGLGHQNWLRFLLWFAIGLAIYFGYGFWHSNLNRRVHSDASLSK